MKIHIKNRRYYRIILWSFSALIFSIILIMISELNSVFFSYGDFAQYWAAGRLNILHQNPYNPESVINLRNEVGQSVELTEHPSMMLYPPWTLPLLIPLGILPYNMSRLVWLLVNIILLIYCTHKIWSMYGGSTKQRWIANLMLITYFPTTLVLLMGHISTFFLLGLVLFIHYLEIKTKSRLNNFIAGVGLALLTIKPQLMPLVFFVIFLWVLDQNRWTVIAGTFGTLFILTLIEIAINPNVLTQYVNVMSMYPLGAWATPTIGILLRLFFGHEIFWLQFIPLLLGIIWMYYYWRRNKYSWNWFEHLPIITFVSILITPYAWTYDYSVLLVPILFAAILLSKSRSTKARNEYLFLFFIINLIVFMIHSKLSDFWFFWYVPVLMVWYFSAVKNYHRNNKPLYSINTQALDKINISKV